MKSLIGCGSHQLLVVSSIGNSIRGGGSSDTILCSTRNDFLEDGAGKDILGGKGRNDAFAFTSLRDSLAAILDITSDCSVGDRLDRLGVFSPPLSLTSASLFASFTAIPKPFAATSSAGIQAHHWPYWYLHRVQ
jgi:Ca2+-binding RTX toxin-like protein